MHCGELPRGGAAIFTESGAFKALALDLCDRVGLELPSFSSKTEGALREALPPFIPPSNPLDLTAQALVDPTLYRRTLAPILDEDRFGSVLLGTILTDPKTTALKLPSILDSIRTLKPDKPCCFQLSTKVRRSIPRISTTSANWASPASHLQNGRSALLHMSQPWNPGILHAVKIAMRHCLNWKPVSCRSTRARRSSRRSEFRSQRDVWRGVSTRRSDCA